MKQILLILYFSFFVFAHASIGNEFLLINNEVQSRAVGGAGVAGHSSFCNPANEIHQYFSLYSSYLFWIDDFKLGRLQLSYPFKYGTIKMFYLSLYAPLTEKIINGFITGQYILYRDSVFGFAFSSRIFKNHFYGLQIKHIRHIFVNQIKNYLAFDIGYKYKTSFSLLFPLFIENKVPLYVGTSVKNLGFPLDTISTESLPIDIRIGLATRFFSNIGTSFAISPYWDLEKVITQDFLIPRYGFKIKTDFFSLSFGGFNDQTFHFSFGAGIYKQVNNMDIVFNYASVPFDTINPQHNFSLMITFFPEGKKVEIYRTTILTNHVTNIIVKTKVVKYETVLTNEKKRMIQTLTVKDFENVREDSNLQYLSHTIAESLSTSLAENTNFQIVQSINSETNVECVLEGSFVEIENKIQINVKLVQGKNRSVLFSQQYITKMGKDIFLVLDKVSKEVTEQLEMRFKQ